MYHGSFNDTESHFLEIAEADRRIPEPYVDWLRDQGCILADGMDWLMRKKMFPVSVTIHSEWVWGITPFKSTNFGWIAGRLYPSLRDALLTAAAARNGHAVYVLSRWEARRLRGGIIPHKCRSLLIRMAFNTWPVRADKHVSWIDMGRCRQPWNKD